jgi:hypothetical protein
MNRANVQLPSKERTCVFYELDTRRIFGFAPEFAQFQLPPGVKWRSEVLFTSREIERWAKKYRDQVVRDEEAKAYNQVMREAPIRAAIRNAILERNKHVNNLNRDLNNAFLRLNEERYQGMIAARAKRETFIAAEAWEEGKDSAEIAMEHPFLNVKAENA